MGNNTGLALPKENFKLIAIGFVIIIIGFALMIGGGAEGSAFNPEIYNFQHITLSTVIAVFGFFFEIYAILRKPKENRDDSLILSDTDKTNVSESKDEIF
ncbi:MAG: DUF3098 domain-containing protein [Paludibacteraceae bacterium]|nr:DUF3098 domain-containing protein [Candidatus Physcocola equi]MCQ2235210.1 DUF3098 domain-containing protein [Paludibacteraceae bacterium]